jgi:Zn-dependent protease with chaperone function
MTQRLVFAAFLLFAPIGAGAAGPARLDEFDRKILAELAALRPEAVRVFEQANQARDRGDHREAAALYAQVHALAPRFDHALRRQAGSELALGNRPQAIALGRKALKASPTAINKAGLALTLSRETPSSRPSKTEQAEALRLAVEAAGADPDDYYVQATLAQVALLAEDAPRLRRAVERLRVLGPDEAATYEFETMLGVLDGRIDAALASLEKARRLGMPEDRYASVRDALLSARPPTQRLASAAAWVGGVWLGGLLLLFIAGIALSRATLAAVGEAPVEANGRASGTSGRLRRTYRAVLWLSCAYYYVSMPLLFVAVLLLGGGLIYAFFAIGRIPIKLVAIIAILVLTTLWSMLKSLFVRGRDEDPGVRLALATHPRLRKVLHEVAARVGTAPVRSVFLTPGTDMAVMERGGVLRQLRGTAERCLILGVGVLDGLRVGPFKAVLAHEYGHFSNRDTAGGGFALAVRRSLLTLAQNLAQGGAAAWYNPVWLFLNLFHRVFLRVSQGASRLQEILADRWAAFTYGAAAFDQGLRHVIERAVRFDAHAGATLKEVVVAKQPLLNLYTHRPVDAPDESAIQQAVQQAMNAAPSPYDSHPAPADRLRWVKAVAAGSQAPPSPEDDAEVWGLFEGRERIEQRLTGEVRENVFRDYGVRIAAPPARAAADRAV